MGKARNVSVEPDAELQQPSVVAAEDEEVVNVCFEFVEYVIYQHN